jgi:pyruvate ferredoxin oxidoreductase alpha subunit
MKPDNNREKAPFAGTTRMSLTGNEAAAWAGRCARIRVGSSFPMGPNMEVTETLRNFVDNGETPDLKIILPDNEKAASSMQIGLSRMGVRSMLCINSEGILWATSEIHYAASSRLPMTIVCPSRALEPPTTVLCDHDDFLSLRDMGWLMFYCENAQDIFDTILQAYRISEHEDVMLPAIVGYDGWETSHAAVRVDIPDQAEIDRFLPAPAFIRPERDYLAVDWKERCTHRRYQEGVGGMQFMEIRYLQKKAEESACTMIASVGEAYRQMSGSRHAGLIESIYCDDAEIILVSMGIVYPSVKFVVNALRRKGVKIGCIKLRVFRPFPANEIIEQVKGAKLVLTLDRNSIAAIFNEIGAAMYRHSEMRTAGPMLMGRIIGVGGMPITLELITEIVEEGLEAVARGRVEKELEWMPIYGIEYDPTRHVLAE